MKEVERIGVSLDKKLLSIFDRLIDKLSGLRLVVGDKFTIGDSPLRLDR